MIHLEVIVDDVADLLDPAAYGVGALLRWEWCATENGVYAEGGTVGLVAGVSAYEIWDAGGTDDTWYQTRVSDAGGTTFSAYSDPFQSASEYLSLTQAKALLNTTLSDESLLILLDAARKAIDDRIGKIGATSESFHAHGWDILPLAVRPESIASVVERDVTLDATDYELTTTGYALHRLHSGTNPAYRWWGHVKVTYTPVDDLAERQRVQLALVKLDLSTNPGLASQTIGTWSETYATNGPSYKEQRETILASLSPTVPFI